MAGGIGGRAHLHGVADEARRSIPAQCMGLLCMPASGAHVHAVKGAGNTGEVCAARNSGLWRAQQVCAAGARLLRACCTNLLRSATCLMPGAHLASFPGLRSPHAHTHRLILAGMQPMHLEGMLLRAPSANP